MRELIRLFTQILRLFFSSEDKIELINERLNDLEEKIVALKDQIMELINKISDLQTTLSDEVTELKTAFDALRARIDELEGIDLTPQLEAIASAIAGVEALSDLSIEPDTEIPTTPSGLISGLVTATSAELSWVASTDNVGIAKYEVFSGADKFADSIGTGTAFTATGLTAETTYVFSVRAVDKAGNFSAMSDPVTVVTPTA